MTTFTGDKLNNLINGTADADVFKIGQGGHDEIHGDAGNDRIILKAKFDVLDVLDGGADKDTVSLNGAYAGAITFNASTIQDIEVLSFGGAFDYDVTIANGTLSASQKLTVSAKITGGHSLSVDGHALSLGHLLLHDGTGNDTLIGGDSSDKLYLGKGGLDTVRGRDGNDTFYGGTEFTTGDRVIGGAGFDTLVMTGIALSDSITITPTMLTDIEFMLLKTSTFGLEFADANIAAGATLTVDGSAALNVTVNAQFESDGFVSFIGSPGLDVFIGGFGSDTVVATQGGNDLIRASFGADDITCGAGVQTLVFNGSGESSSTFHDHIHGFNANAEDKIDVFPTVTSTSTASGSISVASFDTDMGFALSDGFGANDAAVVTANLGDLIGHVFLVIDMDTVNGYSTSDLVLDVTGFSGNIDTADFI